MSAKRPIPDPTKQRPKKHYCPDCGAAVRLVKAMPGGRMRGRCENGHEHAKAALVLR